MSRVTPAPTRGRTEASQARKPSTPSRPASLPDTGECERETLTTLTPSATAFAVLATHLEGRREAILEVWRRTADADPTLTTGSSLPRSQFRDHVPHLLETFGRILRALAVGGRAAPPGSEQGEGAEHGLQRWQQGYRQREVTREWGHLHLCVLAEMVGYPTTHLAAGPRMLNSRIAE